MAQRGTTDLATIRTIVKKHFQRKLEITDETSLVGGGLIDSMALVDLILDLEEASGVKITIGEVEPEDFDSVLKIAATLDRFRA